MAQMSKNSCSKRRTVHTASDEIGADLVDGLGEADAQGSSDGPKARHIHQNHSEDQSRKVDLLVVLSLIHLKEGHERMGDELADLRVQDGRLNSASASIPCINQYEQQKTHRVGTGNPLLVLAQIIEGPDNLQQRIRRALPDALVVVGQERDELERAGLDEGQEVHLGRGEERADGVGRNLLLDGNGAVDVHHLLDVDVLEVDGGIAVDINLLADGDSVGGRRSGSERAGSVGDRDCEKEMSNDGQTMYIKKAYSRENLHPVQPACSSQGEGAQPARGKARTPRQIHAP